MKNSDKECVTDKKKDILEESFLRLEQILAAMEGGEHSLEESFKLYKEGMGLVEKCNESIDRVEKEMKIYEQEDA